MKTFFLLTVCFLLTPAAFAQNHGNTAQQDHGHMHQHEHDEDPANSNKIMNGSVRLTRTVEINAALDAGGQPVVVEILGVVCDFCAIAMNKTFGKREEVAAVYVDLGTKMLSLVFHPKRTLSDETISDLVTKAGYKVKNIHRGDDVIPEVTDESNHS